MRASFGVDWAFGVRGAIEDTVRRAFPSELRRWPVLQSFNFEAYFVGEGYFVIVLRDKLTGIPAGPGAPVVFPHQDHPAVPVSMNNVDQWHSYLTRKLQLRNEDISMILPVHDSGRSDAAADFDMFTAEERQIWNRQLNAGIARQIEVVQVAMQPPSSTSGNVTYNVSGTNARINIGSSDSSVNISSENSLELFQEMLASIRDAKQANSVLIECSIEAMSSSYGTNQFGECYRNFMSVLADHIQVFGPIIGPYLPALAKLGY